MLDERIEKLMSNGCDRELAILIEWDSADKELISFKELKEFYGLLFAFNLNRPDAIEIMSEKAETFEELKYLWEVISKSEKAEIFKLMKKKAETLEELQFLWKQTAKESSDQCELWKRMMKKAKEIK